MRRLAKIVVVSLIGIAAATIVAGSSPESVVQGKPADTGKAGIALAIGLNSVDPAHYGGWSGDLQACEFDAEDMARIAKARGFTATTVLTKDATRKKLFAEVEKAASALKAGDTFIIAYSGHGGQAPDQNGDEVDNQDETWCLYDGQVLDDELAGLWAKFPKGVRILAFSDSCHSGTVTKVREYAQFFEASPLNLADSLLFKQRFNAVISPDVVSPAKPVPSPVRAMPERVAALTYRKNREFYEKIGKGAPNQRDSEKNTQATVLLISGCQDNQLSADGTFNGLFTGTLKTVWSNGLFTGTYRDFHRAIVRRMPSYQSPNYYVTGAPNTSFEAETPFTR